MGRRASDDSKWVLVRPCFIKTNSAGMWRLVTKKKWINPRFTTCKEHSAIHWPDDNDGNPWESSGRHGWWQISCMVQVYLCHPSSAAERVALKWHVWVARCGCEWFPLVPTPTFLYPLPSSMLILLWKLATHYHNQQEFRAGNNESWWEGESLFTLICERINTHTV